LAIRTIILRSFALAYLIGSIALSGTGDWSRVVYAAEDKPNRILLPVISSAQDGNGQTPGEDTMLDEEFLIFATGTVYYVDCGAGNDANNGKSPAAAWKTVARANQAALSPGDQLRLKRGCRWTGPLDASWRGTPEQPILIGAYGAGELPIIQDAYSTNIRITGTYLVLDSLHATLSTPPNPDPNCRNQPMGWKAGFAFQDGASYNIVQNSKATKLAIGIFFADGSHHNRAVYNTITDNNVVWELRQTSTLGAMGVLLHGDNQEVGHNYFTNNRSLCTYTGVPESNSIELFTARNSFIHHNVSYQDRVFSELGSSSSQRAENNTYAYNLHVVTDNDSSTGPRFLVTRGWNHPFGPVVNTQVYQNTVYLTASDSKGITCGMCGKEILALKNNIFWVDREPVWSDTPFVEANNVYWSSDGRPLVLFQSLFMSSASRIADPQFFDPANGKFNLKANSPAIGQGVLDPVSLTYDLAQTMIAPKTKLDIGAYQFRTAPWRRVFAIPGRIEAENYREGGEGTGYHDTTVGNSGSAYRDDGVDIEDARDGNGAYDVGWVAPGEWLAYDVDVTTVGTYRVVARVASPSGGGRFRLELDGQKVGGSVTIPWTGGWWNWVNVGVTVPLAAGQHTLRLIAETDGFNVNYLDFTKIR